MKTNIIQHELTEAKSTSGVESKIKLRESSHGNLLRNLKNIPYMDNYSNTTTVSNITVEESQPSTQLPTTPNNIEQTDFGDYVTRLNNETQLVNSVKEEALLARENASTSDGEVSRLSIEVSELEKQALDVETKSEELDQQLIEAYNHQSQILQLIREEQEKIIQEANARQKENQEKMAEFQSRIDNIKQRITAKNEDIAKKQAILTALQQTGFSGTESSIDFTNSEEDELVKKIA